MITATQNNWGNIQGKVKLNTKHVKQGFNEIKQEIK